jgi:hypothetical protein
MSFGLHLDLAVVDYRFPPDADYRCVVLAHDHEGRATED